MASAAENLWYSNRSENGNSRWFTSSMSAFLPSSVVTWFRARFLTRIGLKKDKIVKVNRYVFKNRGRNYIQKATVNKALKLIHNLWILMGYLRVFTCITCIYEYFVVKTVKITWKILNSTGHDRMEVLDSYINQIIRDDQIDRCRHLRLDRIHVLLSNLII